MEVAVIGANGGIGRRLVERLGRSSHHPVGVVRSEDQFETIEDLGGEPRFGDVEEECESALEGVDAAVFTAGSGGSTGWDKTLTVDLWGARRTIETCEELGVDRYVMISARGASDPDAGREPLRPYLVAKRAADDYLERSGLDWTILRPTTLTDDVGTGHIRADFDLGKRGPDIPRADVAHAVAVCLERDDMVGQTVELFGGDTPVEKALAPPE